MGLYGIHGWIRARSKTTKRWMSNYDQPGTSYSDCCTRITKYASKTFVVEKQGGLWSLNGNLVCVYAWMGFNKVGSMDME